MSPELLARIEARKRHVADIKADRARRAVARAFGLQLRHEQKLVRFAARHTASDAA
ncbi:MAG TPA: hypothetical protein VJ914_05185 [Pseudonocardiaceae bacterium]|nr:hypothetical protein [Pseudonocardiaceae bacterium]